MAKPPSCRCEEAEGRRGNPGLFFMFWPKKDKFWIASLRLAMTPHGGFERSLFNMQMQIVFIHVAGRSSQERLDKLMEVLQRYSASILDIEQALTHDSF